MDNIQSMLQTAINHHSAGSFEKAEVIYKEVLDKDQDNAQALSLFGTLKAQTGDFSAAIPLLRRALASNPDNPEAHLSLGNALYELRNYEEAAVNFKRVLELAPQAAAAEYNLGKVYQDSGRLDEALECFEHVIKGNPTFFDVHVNAGIVINKMGQLEKAIHYFRQALTLNSNSPEAHCYLGEALTSMGVYEEAETHCKQSIALKPDYMQAHRSFGDLYQSQGRLDEALSCFKKAVELEPDDVPSRMRLGFANLVTGSQQKKDILQNLEEDCLYRSTDEPKQLALELARLYSYSDQQAQDKLIHLFSEFDPAIVYSSEWWESQLKQFGSKQSSHDNIVRGVQSAVYSWSIPSSEALNTVVDFVDGLRVFSYGSGTAYWEYLLQTHCGVNVVVSDMNLRHRFLDMKKIEYETADVEASDVVFISWIPRGDKTTHNIFHKMVSGQKLVLVGEPPDEQGKAKMCATDELFQILQTDFNLLDTHQLVNFSYLNDGIYFYEKN